MSPIFSVIIVTFNSQQYLHKLLDFVSDSYFQANGELIVVDNNSTDGTVEEIKSIHSGTRVIQNQENLGFAKANNQGVLVSQSKYIFFVNSDVVIPSGVFRKVVDQFETNNRIGAIGGKVLRYDFANNQTTKIIDSTGLIIYKNRRVFDRGQGEEDRGQYQNNEEVFGISGAFMAVRREALESIRYQDEFFDEDFFMYKEDIDLSWRLHLKKWQIVYLPEVVVYHGRTTGVLSDQSTVMEILNNRKQISDRVKFLSYRNQRLMEIKNDYWSDRKVNGLEIFWRNFLAFCYAVTRGWFIKSRYDLFLLKSKMLLKREKIGIDADFSIITKWLK